MEALSAIFWLLLFLVFYSYLGYAIIVFILNLFKRRQSFTGGELPPVTVVIPAYNEEAVIEEKLLNTISMNYPAGFIKVIVVADGSTDATVEKASAFPFAQVLFEPERKGKAAALNRAMQHVATPLVIFSDANTILNTDCARNMAKHFGDELTGAVAGEKKVAHTSGVGTAEGWYWKYESYMKKLDGDFYSIVGAAGELFCMRTLLYQPLEEDTIIDDFVLSMDLCLSGYRIRYEPGAYAVELPSANIGEEKKRKLRIASGAFQALSRLPLKRLLHHPALCFQFFSRRWLRWVVCPFAIPLIFILNIFLSALHPSEIYDLLMWGQILFYLSALAGYLMISKAFFLTTIPFYFLFMNYCMIHGLILYRKGKHSALWTRSERALKV